MKNVRIFISSPGDVAEERNRAKQVVEQLRRRYAGRLTLEAVLWEDLPLQADMSFQEGIDIVLSDEHGVDISLFILWSRLGTPLGALITKEDGTEYRSGTEREFDLILCARAQAKEKAGEDHEHEARPDILVYLRTDDTSFDERLRGKSTDEKETLIYQKKLVEQFIREEFHDPEGGTNIRAYHSFNIPTSFSQRLRVHLQELLDQLVSDVEGEPIWDIDKKGSPFRGLEAFDYEHNAVFFGREDEVLEVRQALREQARNGCAFVLISGASGSGKSSLARAGVLPTLTDYEIDDSIAAWRYTVFSPGQVAGDGLLHGLAQFLMSDTVLPELRSDDQSLDDLTEGLIKDPQVTYKLRIKQALQKAAIGKSGAIRLVLLVDQFEELFTDPRIQDEERIAFVNALDALARSGSIWVMATVRSDFYEHCEQVPVLMAMKGSGGQFSVQIPGTDALRRLITEPARLAGLKFEEQDGKTLDSVILDDAAQYPELLPLLEYLLLELFRARTQDKILTFAAYENFAAYTQDGVKLGGIRGALAKRAEETYRQVNSSDAVFASVMSPLITLGGEKGESAVRQTVPFANVTDTPEKNAFVQAFIEARLFATQGEPQQTQNQPQTESPLESGSLNNRPWEGATVSVAHEAFFRVWGKAVNWIEANKEFLRVRAQVDQRMQQGGVLLPGDPLFDRARTQLTQQRERFGDKQLLFIDQAIADTQRKEKRAKKIRYSVIAGLLVLALSAMVGMGWALRSEGLAEQRLAKMSLQNGHRAIKSDDDIGMGLLWYAQALQTTGGQAASARRSARALIGGWIQLMPQHLLFHDSTVVAVSFSPKEDILATASTDGTARFWDASTGMPRGEPLKHDGPVRALSFSPKGALLATASTDGTARLWDTLTGIPRGEPLKHDGPVRALSFSPKDALLATASTDGTARLWDTLTGIPRGEPLKHDGPVRALSFSPNGAMLATAGGEKYSPDARLWDVATGQLCAGPLEQEQSVLSVVFSPDGSTLATAGERGTVLWDTVTWQHGETIVNGDAVSINAASFSTDGTTFITAGDDGSVYTWRLPTGIHLNTFNHDGPVNAVSLSQDGKNLATASNDGKARLWTRWDFGKVNSPDRTFKHNDSVNAVSFSPDGTTLVTASRDGPARVWNLLRRRINLPYFDFSGPAEAVVSFSPDGETLVASDDETMRLWNVANGKVEGTLLKHSNVKTVSFSPDGATLVTADGDGTVRLWNVAKKRFDGTPFDHDSLIKAMPVSATLARTMDGMMRKYVSFSPDGATLAIASGGGTVRMWNVAKKKFYGVPLDHESP